MQNSRTLAIAILCLALPAAPAVAMDKPYPGPYVENDDLLVVLRPHHRESMAAFYEARGFPQAAIDLISRSCFITVHVHNRSDDTLWLDVSEWRFSSGGNPVSRLDRAYWDRQWENIDLRQASRSTFGWTQLPQVRDLQPDEPVGGNLTFPLGHDTIDLTLKLPTGKDRRGRLISVEFRDIACPAQAPAE